MKSKEQKRQEAIERKKAAVPEAIKRLQALVADAKASPGSAGVLALAVSAEEALARTYREIGMSPAEAEGAARAVAMGRDPGAWLSGLESGSRSAVESARREEQEPSDIQAVVKRTGQVVRDVRAVCLLPHPFRRAIQIRADGPHSDGSLIANLEILELDRLASAFRNEGVRVFRSEAAYMEYQRAESWVLPGEGKISFGEQGESAQ